MYKLRCMLINAEKIKEALSNKDERIWRMDAEKMEKGIWHIDDYRSNF